eukprot:comp22584_c0_seq1/m.34575 comp22584_c0_seq1/g.34575  ORF comp22584_c0_seq1/g.34575 comp22584_c0_seq1/m.34575 type:complete len:113 (-) comp22584_c0_seq1:481-819(-)
MAKQLRPFDEFMGGFDMDAVKDTSKLQERLKVNLKYFLPNYVAITVFLIVVSSLMGKSPVGYLLSLTLVLAHAITRPRTVGSTTAVFAQNMGAKMEGAKQKIADKIDAAKKK